MTTENISAVITAHNEQDRLSALFASLKGIDDIVLIDFESTDKTAKVAKKLGARVIQAENAYAIATEDDVKEFKRRYTFKPHFKKGQKMAVRYMDRNMAQSYAKNDWVYFPDCDEIITWNLKKLKKLLPDYDMISHKFIQSYNPDGSPAHWFHGDKIFRKSKTWWYGRSHEAVKGHNLRVFYDESIVVNHYQKNKADRDTYLSLFEYMMYRDQDTRSAYYLGREYFVKGFYKEAYHFLKIYMETASWRAEIVKAYQMMARSMWCMYEEEKAFVYAFQALLNDPNKKDTFILLAEMSRPKEARYWRKYAEMVTDESHEI